MSLLFSYAETGIIQLTHYDIRKPKRGEKIYWIPFQNQTTINIIPGSHKGIHMQNKVTPIKLMLNRGDILEMHPLLLHAGDCFPEDNLRAHFYYIKVPKGQAVDTNPFNTYPESNFFAEHLELCTERISKIKDITTAHITKKANDKEVKTSRQLHAADMREKKRLKRNACHV